MAKCQQLGTSKSGYKLRKILFPVHYRVKHTSEIVVLTMKKQTSSAFKASSDTGLVRNKEIVEVSLCAKEHLSLACHFEIPQQSISEAKT